MQIQRTILLKFAQNKEIEALTKLETQKFSGEHLRILRFLQEFVIDNKGKLPTKAIMKRHFPSFARDMRHKIKEPTKYLLQELDNAHTHNTLVDVVSQVSKDLKNKDEMKPEEVLKNLERQVLELRSRVTSDNQKGQDITKQRVRIQEKLVHRRKQGGILGFHFPHPSLTKFLRGLRKKRLYTLIARTSVGKTAFSFLVAMHVWRTYNVPVLFLSGELDYEQMEDQYLSLLTGLPVSKIENGDLTEKEEKLIDEKLREVENKAPFIFGHAGGISDVITELNTHNPEILFVDSFYELDRFVEPDDTKRTAMTSSRLQRISREYDMPVFINSQANRATDKKKGADLSNISFSDTIGQTSDVVITLIQSDEMRIAREMEIVLLKNRGGRLAKVLCNWNWEEHDFSEIREIDEFGESANDTSELTNAQVDKDAEEGKYDKLLGRTKRGRKKKEDKPVKKTIKKRNKKDEIDENTGRPKRGAQRNPTGGKKVA